MATFGYLGGNEDFHRSESRQIANNLQVGMAEWRTYKKGTRNRTEIGARLAVLAGRVLAHIDSQSTPDTALKFRINHIIDELEGG